MITEICKAAEKYSPGYEWERVYEELQEQRQKSKTPQQADGASNLQRSKLWGL